MKKMFTKKRPVTNLAIAAALMAGGMFSSGSSFGQGTYYSRFSNPVNHYAKTDPTDCDVNGIQNIVGLADNDLTTYAFFTANNLETPYTCTGRYLFNADLNLPLGKYSVAAGQQAGFRLRIPSGIAGDSLGKYVTITTYLRDSVNPSNVTYQEYATGGGSSGLDLYGTVIDPSGKDWLLYFNTTKPFNLVELAVDPKIIQLNSAFEFDTYFAFGGASSVVLPAHIANFKATVSGKNVNISWQSLTETNVSTYRIERSNDNGSFTTVATLPAKGNSSTALSYSFTDKVGIDGNYLYHIVIVNKDGSSTTSNALSALISGQGKLALYPTIVKAGQSVTVKTSETGLVSVYLFDAQGRLVKQQRTTSSGQFTIPTSGLSAGVYNVKIVSASGAVLHSKIVVN